MHENPLFPVVAFLIDEVKDARSRSVSPADQYLIHFMVRRAERQNRRLRRVADALTRLDESNPPPAQ